MENKVIGLNTKTLEEKEFNSIQEAQKEVGNKGTVKRCLNNEIKSTKGWMFKYKGQDFPSKAQEITDKRIKVYEMKKGEEVIQLPLEMLQNTVGISKSSIIEASRGYKKTPSGARIKTKFAKGYTVRELDKEESDKVLDNISYIDYLYSKKEPKSLEKIQSIGEHIVETMLEDNSINYEKEKPIPGTRMLMDFYVENEGNRICIEYQGVHHDRTRYQGESVNYEEKEKYDKNKKDYCESNGIKHVEINHDFTINKIYRTLEQEVGIENFPKEYTLYRGIRINIDEFLKYYLENNREQTASKYSLKQTDVKNLLDKLEYSNKRKPTETITVIDKQTNEILGEGDYYSVQEDFPALTKSAISAMKSGRLKSSKGYRLEFTK